MSGVATAIGVTGYLSSEAAGDAAEIGAGSADRAADLQYQQYQQTRQDLAPYREVAVGRPIYGNQVAYENALREWQTTDGNPMTRPTQDMFGDPDEVTSYTGGALQQLAEYGPSQVVEGEYIPASDVPQFQGRTPGYGTSIAGDVPQYSGEVDVYSDPSYQFRLGEMTRGIDRAMAGMGKLTSGNRLEEIMSRTGEMASQEYGAAYGRQLQDYNVQRQNEAIQYARDTGDWERARQLEQELYGRDVTGYQMDVARENMLYGRGVDAYGRAYGREQDYLNRQSSLANIGQTATGQTAGAGQAYAQTAGQMIQSAGQARAAGELGQAAAVTGAVGDLTSLYAMNQMRQPPTYTTDYSIPMQSWSAP